MRKLSAFGAYVMFVLLKTHFTKDRFDFFTYAGKSKKISREAFEARNDKLQFEQLARRYDASELRDYYVANLVADRLYVTDMINDEAVTCYQGYVKRQQSFSYHIKSEINKLRSDDGKLTFTYKKGQYPELVMRVLSGTTSWETFVVLNDFLNIVQRCDETLGTDDVIWSKVRRKVLKLKPFLHYEPDKLALCLDS